VFVVARLTRVAVVEKRPLYALRETRALPPTVFGPVDRSHGFQRRISAACRARRSGVQPFTVSHFGQEQPYSEVTDSGRSIALSTHSSRSYVDFLAITPRDRKAWIASIAGTS
jgi:hypothetical protein